MALVLALLTLRMSGHYLPLATIAWALALYHTMSNMEFLGKYDGLLGIPPLSIGGWPGRARVYCLLIWAVALIAAAGVLRRWIRAPGRAIRALHGGSVMAEAMGVSTFGCKVKVFLIAALLASVSGLAVCPSTRHQPLALLAGQGHRIPLHGRARWRGQRVGAFTGATVIKAAGGRDPGLAAAFIGTGNC